MTALVEPDAAAAAAAAASIFGILGTPRWIWRKSLVMGSPDTVLGKLASEFVIAARPLERSRNLGLGLHVLDVL